MKFIKTCYGEWVNPALVKHFSIDHKEFSNGTTAYRALADGVPLQVFPYEIRYVEVEYETERYGYKSKDTRWEVAPDCDKKKILGETRAKACNYLAELVGKLNEVTT